MDLILWRHAEAHPLQPGESDLAHARVGHQHVSDVGARAGEALHGVGRRAGLEEDLGDRDAGHVRRAARAYRRACRLLMAANWPRGCKTARSMPKND